MIEKEIKIIIDKKGNKIRKLVTKKKSDSAIINEIVNNSDIIQDLKQNIGNLKDISKKIVYFEEN